MKFAFSLAAGALLLMAGSATAQDRSSRGVRDLIDTYVNLDGRSLGRVTDVTLSDRGSAQDVIIRTRDGLVAVPYSAVRYDDRERAYLIASGIKPRPIAETKRTQTLATREDRYSRGGGRLERDETPPATIERRPATYQFESPRLASLARAARLYSEPTGSVSMTRNIDRLPARSYTYSNETLAGDVYGYRSPERILPPPIASSSTTALYGR